MILTTLKILVMYFPEPEVDENDRKCTNKQHIGSSLIIVNLFCFDYFLLNTILFIETLRNLIDEESSR